MPPRAQPAPPSNASCSPLPLTWFGHHCGNSPLRDAILFFPELRLLWQILSSWAGGGPSTHLVSGPLTQEKSPTHRKYWPRIGTEMGAVANGTTASKRLDPRYGASPSRCLLRCYTLACRGAAE